MKALSAGNDYGNDIYDNRDNENMYKWTFTDNRNSMLSDWLSCLGLNMVSVGFLALILRSSDVGGGQQIVFLFCSIVLPLAGWSFCILLFLYVRCTVVSDLHSRSDFPTLRLQRVCSRHAIFLVWRGQHPWSDNLFPTLGIPGTGRWMVNLSWTIQETIEMKQSISGRSSSPKTTTINGTDNDRLKW